MDDDFVFEGSWTSVNTKLPPDGVKVLLATVTKKGIQNIVLGYYCDNLGSFACGMNSKVTHWMWLPEAPALEDKHD